MVFGRIRTFIRNQGGNVGIIFALAAVPTFVLMGGIVDYANIQNERHKLQAALDAGTLAALQIKNVDNTKAKNKIKEYLEANYHPSSGITINYNDDLHVNVGKTAKGNPQVTATLNVKVRTAFWGLLGLSKAGMTIVSQTRTGMKSLEVALVLDNTGSMGATIPGDSKTKIEALRDAANTLVDTLKSLSGKSGMNSVKVGLVPFTNYVRMDTSYWGSSWLSGCETPRNGRAGTCSKWRIKKDEWQGYVGVRETGGDYDLVDGRYDSYPVPAIANAYQVDDPDGDSYTMNTELSTIQPLVSLDDDSAVTELKNKIQDMGADGWTYIPAGLVWGWRLLSAREPFTQGANASEPVEKVVVLMTDGANTCVRDNEHYMRCYDVDTSIADSRLSQLCQNVKNDGVKIISIAFAITDVQIRNLLISCQNIGYYEPKNANELTNVFDQIAVRLAQLHISR